MVKWSTTSQAIKTKFMLWTGLLLGRWLAVGERQSYSDLELIDCNLIVPPSWVNAPKKLS